jgi:hypothetical protein
LSVAINRDPQPLLQLTRTGALWRSTDLSGLQRTFAERHHVVLPSLFDPALLALVGREIERGEFKEHAHGSIATELRLQPGICTGLLLFIVNDPELYRFVEIVTSITPIRSFTGRVYRRHAERHHDSWHSDLDEDRRVGMSINLTSEPYEGGVFEIRDVGTEETLASTANIGFGDALLFRLAPVLRHRVTAVRGTVPKTAFAGWFLSEHDYQARLRREALVSDAI